MNEKVCHTETESSTEVYIGEGKATLAITVDPGRSEGCIKRCLKFLPFILFWLFTFWALRDIIISEGSFFVLQNI